MVDQQADQSKYNDPDRQVTDRTSRKVLQQIVQQIKEKQRCTSSDRCDHGTFSQKIKNIPIAINTHPSRKKARWMNNQQENVQFLEV